MCYLKIQHDTSNFSSETNTTTTTSEASFGSEIVMNLHFPASSTIQGYCMAKATQTEDIAYYVHEHLRNIQKDTQCLIEQEHNLFEQSLAPEIDIEEITLRKSDSNERLGLTVCYSNGDEYVDGEVCTAIGGEIYNEATVAEVYISDIHPDSVAWRDGRLRQGDQILQINGKDIKTRLETKTLIAENNNAVTLLVSRYLYADEDDFNDPSTNEDDEVLVMEDDDEDDDDDEFYDDNNLTYVNCMMNNDCCINASDELDKALMSHVEQQHEQLKQTSEKSEEKGFLNNTPSTVLTNAAYQSNSLKDTSDGQQENEKVSKIYNQTSTKGGNNVRPMSSKKHTLTCAGGIAHDDYESEHIYETIPEHPESEPFYCSPYDSSVYVTAIASCSSSTTTDAIHQLQQKQRVAQWLGINPLQSTCGTTAPRQCSRSGIGYGSSLAHRHKSTNSTVISALTTVTNGSVNCSVTSVVLPVHSQLEDQDNSSSAYNTGGSNNSVSPLTLMLNPINGTDQNHTFACQPTNTTPNEVTEDALGMQQLNQKTPNQQKNNSPKDKSKIISPKWSFQFLKSNGGTNKLSIMDMKRQLHVLDRSLYTNKETNVNRNILSRHHLYNQGLSLDKTLQHHPPQQRHHNYYQQQSDQIQCPEFTAPNLSQYHFVSSQEVYVPIEGFVNMETRSKTGPKRFIVGLDLSPHKVNNLSLNNKVPKSSTAIAATINNKTINEEEAMVWKVKRRPDGTRYIVRRPAKNRVMKERNIRLNVERIRNDIATTEDDTISEIKTGRYWTREERKKHIEKARERRQQQLQYQEQQNKLHLAYDDSATAMLSIGDATTKISHEQRERQQLRSANPAHQQHYQLQFNSVDGQKRNLSLNAHKVESPSILPITPEEVSNLDQQEILTTTTTFTSAENNQTNSALISVSTA